MASAHYMLGREHELRQAAWLEQGTLAHNQRLAGVQERLERAGGWNPESIRGALDARNELEARRLEHVQRARELARESR